MSQFQAETQGTEGTRILLLSQARIQDKKQK